MCVYEDLPIKFICSTTGAQESVTVQIKFCLVSSKTAMFGTILATLYLLIARRHAMGVDVNLHFNINTVLKGKKKTLQMKMSKFV